MIEIRKDLGMHCIHSLESEERDMTDTMEKVKCKRQGCGKLFIPKRKWQVFCCRKCQIDYWQLIRKEVTIAIRKNMTDSEE